VRIYVSAAHRPRTARIIRRIIPVALGALAITAAPALAEVDPNAPIECTTPSATGYAAYCYTDIMIQKTAPKATYAPGETIQWTITVSNEGQTPIPVSHITVIDPTLTDLHLVSAPADGYLRSKQQMIFQATTPVTAGMCGENTRRTEVDLPTKIYGPDDRDVANDRGDATFTVVCAPPAPPAPPVVVVAPAPVAPPPPAVAPVIRTTAVCPAVTLGAQVRASKGVTAGQVTRVMLTARNTSTTNTASGAVLTYRLPSGMSLTARPAGSSLRRGVLTMRLGSLAPSSRRAVALKVRVDRSSAGIRMHRAGISSRCSAAIATTARTRITQVGPRVRPAVAG
jgi:uncharacterized repeat protein (TIGR01451 family)